MKEHFYQDRQLALGKQDLTVLVRIDENYAKHVGFFALDNAQKVEQVKLDKAEAVEVDRIANILNLDAARKGKVG